MVKCLNVTQVWRVDSVDKLAPGFLLFNLHVSRSLAFFAVLPPSSTSLQCVVHTTVYHDNIQTSQPAQSTYCHLVGDLQRVLIGGPPHSTAPAPLACNWLYMLSPTPPPPPPHPHHHRPHHRHHQTPLNHPAPAPAPATHPPQSQAHEHVPQRRRLHQHQHQARRA